MIKKAIIIGGSAGSLSVLMGILEDCPTEFEHPMIVVVHRGKNSTTALQEILENHSKRPVIEAEHYQQLENGTVYLAPADYHLLIGKDLHFELDFSEKVLFSRPSIDVSFGSFSETFKDKLIGVVLTGANKDGAAGTTEILTKGGLIVVQDPKDAEVPNMPEAALIANPEIEHIVPSNQLMKTLLNLTTKYEPTRR